MENDAGGRCPGEHERKALAMVAEAKRRDELTVRFDQFVKGVADSDGATDGDLLMIYEILTSKLGKSRDYL